MYGFGEPCAWPHPAESKRNPCSVADQAGFVKQGLKAGMPTPSKWFYVNWLLGSPGVGETARP